MSGTSYKLFIKNNSLVLLGHILIYAKGILLMPLIIKTVGSTIYGGYVLLVTFFGFLFGVSSFGVGFQRSRFLPSTSDRNTRSALFYTSFSFQFVSILILSIIFVIFYSYFGKILFKGEVSFGKWLVVPYLVGYLLYSQFTDYFRYTHRINFFNIATISYPYVNIGLIILVYFLGNKITINILLTLETISFFIVALPLLCKMVHEIGFQFIFPKIERIIADIKLGMPLVLGYIMDVILSSSDKYFIAVFLSVAAVGYYSPAYALGSLVVFFCKSFRSGVASIVMQSNGQQQ